MKLTIQKYLASITAVYPCKTMTPWKVQNFLFRDHEKKTEEFTLPGTQLITRSIKNKALMIQFSNDYPNARMPQKNTGLIFCSIWWLWLVS